MSTKVNNDGLPIAQCKCDAKILILPDAKVMDKAINARLAHCPLIEQSNNKSTVKRELCDYIITQVFKLAAQHPLSKKADYWPLLEGDTILTV